MKSGTARPDQTEPMGQLSEMCSSGLVTLRVNGERARIHIELLGKIVEQHWRRHLVRLQHTTGMPQADQY